MPIVQDSVIGPPVVGGNIVDRLDILSAPEARDSYTSAMAPWPELDTSPAQSRAGRIQMTP